MKKCARCDAEYDDSYDGCPACAHASTTRCPTCGKDYDANYAHCPACAAAAALQPRVAPVQPTGPQVAKVWLAGCNLVISLAVLGFLFLCALSSCSR